MGREIDRLGPRRITNEKRPGMHADGAGLYLQVTSPTSKSWIFRYKRHGKAHEMGLGSVNAFGLAEARERARDQRKLLADGLDPIEERDRRRQAALLEAARSLTFKECATSYATAHSAGWSNPKHAKQWVRTLETYVYPTLGALPVQAIDTPLVLKVLQPIWTKKPETAGRVRGRIEAVLDYATAAGSRKGDNPARWTGLLSELLPNKAKVRKVRHMPALPYAELPAFMIELRQQEGDAARALELAILCANRTTEAISARWPRSTPPRRYGQCRPSA